MLIRLVSVYNLLSIVFQNMFQRTMSHLFLQEHFVYLAY
nr:MAG TPA: hypothetical protein [Caudoviricetes sp.]